MHIMNFMTRYYYKSFLALLFAGLWLLNSCEEPPTMIGSGLLPIGDHIPVFSTDTFEVRSYTNYIDKINTEAFKTPYIGTYNDPYFGTTTSGFVTQLRLEERWYGASWGDTVNLEVDSVKLFLRITSNYGSNDNFKYLRISEISDTLYNNTTYNSDTPVNTTGFGVSAIIPPLRGDTINNIEITLPPSFGKELIFRDTSMLFYATDPTEEDFRDHFKGIYITIPSASASDQFLLGFDFNYGADQDAYDYRNYIVIYLHDSNNKSYTDQFRFLLDPKHENAHFTKIEHDFSSALPKYSIENVIKGQVIDTLSYVQGLYGAYTKISIPGLETIKNDPNRVRSAVNKARLIIPAYLDGVTYIDTTVTQSLLMRYVNASGEREIVPDYYVGSESYGNYFSGVYDAEKREYQFNLSYFVQDYLNDTQNELKPELEIFIPANNVSNAILKANDSKTPPKFELTLTKY